MRVVIRNRFFRENTFGGSPVIAEIAALYFRFVRGVPYIGVLNLAPDSSGKIRLGRWQRFLCQHAGRIGIFSPSARAVLESNGIPRSKIREISQAEEQGDALLLSELRRISPLYRAFQRTADFFLAGTALLILSPVLLAVAVAVRWKLGSPILFRQARPGIYARPFQIIKFRTMTDARDSEGNLLPDADRLPPLGAALRRYSLDELPQLWNVVKGDLSLVGPRPLLMRYVPRYTPEQARRMDVKPGITGWAQINGRNALSWEEKFKLDTWYVDHESLALYLRILLKTFSKAWKREGISQAGHATMPEFIGNGSS